MNNKIKCAVCGKAFSPKSHNSKVCSDKCRKALKAKNDKSRHDKTAVGKKPVAIKEKIRLPKKCVKTVVVHKGDIVEFDNSFSIGDILEFATMITVRIMNGAIKEVFGKAEKKAKK